MEILVSESLELKTQKWTGSAKDSVRIKKYKKNNM